jgi:hypothetical protein
MKPITGNKKPHLTRQADVNRGFKDIYDTLNKLIDAVNSSFLPHETFKGKRGDIRVNDEGFQYHDGRNWQRIASGTEGHDEPALMMSTDLPRVPANTMYQGNAYGRIQASPLQYPSADGTSNQPVVTSGAGILSFSSTIDLNKITASGNFEIDSGGDITFDVAGGDINFKVSGTGPRYNWSSSSGLTVYSPVDYENDYFRLAPSISAGELTIFTHDESGGFGGNLKLRPNGDLHLDPDTGKIKAMMDGTEYSAADSAYAGMILGYTCLEGDGTNISAFEIQNSMTVEDSTHQISFKTPPSEKVEIEATFTINNGSTDTRIDVGLSDNSTYNSIGAAFEYDNTGITFSDDEIDDSVCTVKWVLEAAELAAIGSSNTFYIGFSTHGVTKSAWLQYGHRASHGVTDHPFIIKATALPASIYTG